MDSESRRAVNNLNTTPLIESDRDGPAPLRDNSTTSVGIFSVEVLFTGIRERILGLIDKHDAVFGVVAWLTDSGILDALKDKHVSIVIQKEDFLRPCVGELDWHSRLRKLYCAIPAKVSRYDRVPDPLRWMSCAHGDQVEPLRCAGSVPPNRAAPGPRFHSKFAVFADIERVHGEYGEETGYQPKAVITGSYNWTNNAAKSRENAVVIHGEEIARAYWKEWATVCAVSEPLDWLAEYIEPEWRIGT